MIMLEMDTHTVKPPISDNPYYKIGSNYRKCRNCHEVFQTRKIILEIVTKARNFPYTVSWTK